MPPEFGTSAAGDGEREQPILIGAATPAGARRDWPARAGFRWDRARKTMG